MAPEPNTAKPIIDLFGGARILSEALGHRHPTTVQSWGRRARIPLKHHQKIMDIGQQMGIIITPAMFVSAGDGIEDGMVSVLTRLQTIENLVRGVIVDVTKTDPDVADRRTARATRRTRRRARQAVT